jgi:RNA-binding protein NOB1
MEYDVITTKSVISELRDPISKQKAKTHFKDFKIINPDNKHISRVMKFAQSTGDYLSLSIADVEVIALGIQKVVENGHDDKLRAAP